MKPKAATPPGPPKTIFSCTFVLPKTNQNGPKTDQKRTKTEQKQTKTEAPTDTGCGEGQPVSVGGPKTDQKQTKTDQKRTKHRPKRNKSACASASASASSSAGTSASASATASARAGASAIAGAWNPSRTGTWWNYERDMESIPRWYTMDMLEHFHCVRTWNGINFRKAS